MGYLDTSSVWTILTSTQYAPPGYPHLGPVDLQPIISLITFFKQNNAFQLYLIL